VKFLPGLASNHDPLLSLASQVARIAGVSHWHPVLFTFLKDYSGYLVMDSLQGDMRRNEETSYEASLSKRRWWLRGGHRGTCQ
jgi:hypothetical protein